MTLWDAIGERIAAATDGPFRVDSRQSVGGGCINSAWRISGGGRDYFVKTNRVARLAMFEAEARGLGEIAATGAIRVPRPIAVGTAGDSAYLVLEYIELGSGRGSAEALGRQLADLHRVTRGRYGWDQDNTIGSTPQPNGQDADWVRFWRERRLGFQLELAARKGHGGGLQRKGAQLMERFPVLFDGYRPAASLLHGDLWGGNWSSDPAGNPVLYDPAVYYGDREADLAMTELFGGFGAGFFRAYDQAYPIDAGYGIRKILYNLYHILNHLNLFGGGYGAQAEAMMDRLLGELA